MKNTIASLLLLSAIAASAQTHEIFFDDYEKSIWKEVYRISSEEGWFLKNKGVYVVNEIKMSAADTQWGISMAYSIRGLNSSPTRYTYVYGIPILFYDNPQNAPMPREDLEKILAGHVFRDPEKLDRRVTMSAGLFRDEPRIMGAGGKPIFFSGDPPMKTDGIPMGRYIKVTFDKQYLMRISRSVFGTAGLEQAVKDKLP